MGEAQLKIVEKTLVIVSHLITYGGAATEQLTEQIREEIERMWNEPRGRVLLHNQSFDVRFLITAEWTPGITELEVLQNTDPRNNYFRIEDFAHSHISFVDGLGCNTGYLLLENLYPGSTTAAHEYGHTLGLDHPEKLDIRGDGVPGIMYPRGTLVDPPYQYDPSVPAGQKGGTLHPMYRSVRQEDISNIRLHRLPFKNGKAVVGDFTNIFHWSHREIGPYDSSVPPVLG